MTHVEQMTRTNPGDIPVDEATLIECIEACRDCAQACTACADACLGEEQVTELRRCIRLDLDCADVCQTAFERRTARAQLEACVEACRACGEERGEHAERWAWSIAGRVVKPAAAVRGRATRCSLRWRPERKGERWIGTRRAALRPKTTSLREGGFSGRVVSGATLPREKETQA